MTTPRKKKRLYTVQDIQADPFLIRKVPKYQQTPEICMAAVQTYGTEIRSLKVPQTPALCLAAVQHQGVALMFVEEQFRSPEVCKAAVMNSGYALEYVPEPLRTLELCLRAVADAGGAFKFVPAEWQTFKNGMLRDLAVCSDGKALACIDNPTYEQQLLAVTSNGLALELIPSQTPELVLRAVQSNGDALLYINLPTDRLLDASNGVLETWCQVLKEFDELDVSILPKPLADFLQSIPLGKQHLDEWLQPVDEDRLLLDILLEIDSQLRGLLPGFLPLKPFSEKVSRLSELALAQQAKRTRQPTGPAKREVDTEAVL